MSKALSVDEISRLTSHYMACTRRERPIVFDRHKVATVGCTGRNIGEAPMIAFAFVLGVVCGALAMLGASVLDGDVDTERERR